MCPSEIAQGLCLSAQLLTCSPRLVEIQGGQQQASEDGDDGQKLAPIVDDIQFMGDLDLLWNQLGFAFADMDKGVFMHGHVFPVERQCQHY